VSADRLDTLLQDIEPRTIAGASAALLLVWLLAGVLYGIKPAWEELAELTSRYDLALETQRGAEGPGPGPELAALDAEVASLRDALYGGSARVPRTRIESFVVESLDRLSGRHGVSLRSITPDEPSSIWRFEELPYDVTVEGSYFAIHRWIYDVEQELRPMVLKQFQIHPARATPAS
jgi:hypothetical protein